MKRLTTIFGLLGITALAAQGQIQLSGGLTYSQNFDTLSSTPAAIPAWTDNTTLPGWYASRALPSLLAYTNYRTSGGELNTGSIYSYGTNGVNTMADRALGSASSGTPGTNAWGVRIQNDTAQILGNVTISYTGEQWRNGGNLTAQTMTFTYGTSSTPYSSPISANPGDPNFTTVAALSFITPTTGATATALDGNAAANQTVFSNVLVPGVTLNPGDEILLRWYDINDPGNDHGFAVDDFTVSFSQVPEPSTAVLGGLALLSLAFRRRMRY